ncbi:MAG: hypothetical protein IPM26_02755 [Saprospiraceae bacterium]|nr:hypothetical protein [Saprospiraceae bacterium]
MKQLLIVCLMIGLPLLGNTQVGYGFTVTNDLYQRLKNPADGIASPSAGSVLLNIGAGPKLWFGGHKASFSVESQAVIAPLGFSVGDYKGLGMVSFPILAKINFKGLSSFDREGKLGFSIGGGIQYSRTELFGVTDKYAARGVSRSYFSTYVIQAGYGFGISGFAIQGFLRLGYNPDDKSHAGHFGIQYDFNMPMLRKITSPESEL